MSDPKTAGHGDAHAAPAGGGGIDIKTISKVVIWIILIFFVMIFAIIIVIVNPTTAQNFIYFLQGLQVLFGVVILFCFYKLQDFRKRFLATCHDIDHLFAEKNGQGHGHGSHGHSDQNHAGHGSGDTGHDNHGHGHGHDGNHHKKDESNKFLDKIPENIYEEKFQRAMKNVGSEYREEWRLGLVELEKLLKDLLFNNGFNGETLDELLEDAKNKKYVNYENVLTAIKTRKFLSKDLAKLPDRSEHKTYQNVATLYKLGINELLEH